jgi:hypothetical protein
VNSALGEGSEEFADVAFEGGAACNGEGEAGDRFAGVNFFLDFDHAGLGEALGVGGEVSVGEVGAGAQGDEILLIFDRQGGENRQATGIDDSGVECHGIVIGAGGMKTLSGKELWEH